ncbi:hypothetical protein HELRODRAFT_178210 [Helobdella robusta]|uniref:Peptidase A2 domain-containing protein n=1 Tax=Helobdella robusta TaxID=6412 RepID=T1FCY1_HELRO|nr:hypothetical protein HELRODRAFT_178210 [Helobdella robusta]ESN97419.1 hypothetical protein HELRODRAFT_178210 [Helobdella robusta]
MAVYSLAQRIKMVDLITRITNTKDAANSIKAMLMEAGKYGYRDLSYFFLLLDRTSFQKRSSICAVEEDINSFVIVKLAIHSCTANQENCWWKELYLNGMKVRCKLDTGAEVNVMSKTVFEQLPKRPKLTKTNTVLKPYGSGKLQPLGSSFVETIIKENGLTLRRNRRDLIYTKEDPPICAPPVDDSTDHFPPLETTQPQRLEFTLSATVQQLVKGYFRDVQQRSSMNFTNRWVLRFALNFVSDGKVVREVASAREQDMEIYEKRKGREQLDEQQS